VSDGGEEGHVGSHLPADGPETCGDLGFLVRGDVNLQVGQGVEVVELAPVLSMQR
jgi:hypothetical protein